MFSISPKRVVSILRWLISIALTAGSIYVIFYSVFFFLISRDLYLRNVEDATARNSRGDKVFAETNFEGGETHPWKTVIWLKRAGHLFSTTLLEANSFDILVGLKWQDNKHLILQLDFGCDGTHSTPVETIGPIRVTYRFGDPGKLSVPGYESAPRPEPRQPCD